jgi:hypothetical protein
MRLSKGALLSAAANGDDEMRLREHGTHEVSEATRAGLLAETALRTTYLDGTAAMAHGEIMARPHDPDGTANQLAKKHRLGGMSAKATGPGFARRETEPAHDVHDAGPTVLVAITEDVTQTPTARQIN